LDRRLDPPGIEAGLADCDVITTRSDLEALAKVLVKEDVLAVDTEADSFYHYFDKTCLVQIASRKQTWLVDPLALGGPAELAPLEAIFASPKVRTIFHAAEYDIFVLKRDCGFKFCNLFDTMVSAQLLGYPAIGLSALIEHHFGVKLPKDEQRSDWSRRPLSDNQLTYAVSDVRYLIRLAEKLEKELQKAGRLAWAEADFQVLTQREWPEREFDRLGYLRIKGARALDPVSLAILRELYLLRDERAREVDRPPFKVLGNRTLFELVHERPASSEDLVRIKGVTDLIVRRMGNDLLKAIARGIKKPHGPIPRVENVPRRRMDRNTEHRVTLLKRWRGARAQELKLDPGVLCPNSALEAIAWREPAEADDLLGLTELKPWFVESFGAEVAEILRTAPTPDPESEGDSSERRRPARRRRRRS
jgi:ribonuclease D